MGCYTIDTFWSSLITLEDVYHHPIVHPWLVTNLNMTPFTMGTPTLGLPVASSEHVYICRRVNGG
jgi:hypothetical protein